MHPIINNNMALLLKQKDFNEQCTHYYLNGKLCDSLLKWTNNEFLFSYNNTYCTAPDIYQVAKWLRENHSLHITIESSQIYYYFTIKHMPNSNKVMSDKKYDSFEMCFNDCLLFVIQNLI